MREARGLGNEANHALQSRRTVKVVPGEETMNFARAQDV